MTPNTLIVKPIHGLISEAVRDKPAQYISMWVWVSGYGPNTLAWVSAVDLLSFSVSEP